MLSLFGKGLLPIVTQPEVAFVTHSCHLVEFTSLRTQEIISHTELVYK